MQIEANLQKSPCSDCSLQLESMKLESLVIVNQRVTVNKYSSLVHTARHILKVNQARIGFFFIIMASVVMTIVIITKSRKSLVCNRNEVVTR